MRTRFNLGLAAAVLFCMGVTASASTLYDPSVDFSEAGTPGGVWSFRQGASDLAQLMSLSLINVENAGATNLDFLTGDAVINSSNPAFGEELSIVWKAFGADH